MLLCLALGACGGAQRQDAAKPPGASPGSSAERVLAIPADPAPQDYDATPGAFAVAGGAQIRIGLLLPLSGPRAGLGQSLLDAAQLALFDFSGTKVVLLPRDTLGTAEGAAAAARDVLAEGAQLLLGPIFSEEVAASAPLARAAGRNMIAFSTDVRVAGNGVFLLSFPLRQEITRIVAYAQSQGLTRIAALVPRTAYGELVTGAYQAAMIAAGHAGNMNLVYYAPNSQAMHEPVRRLADYDARRAALLAEIARVEASDDAFAQAALAELKTRDTFGDVDFDALLIAEGGASLRALAPLLPYYEIDPAKVRFLGTGLWVAPDMQKETALTGAWFPAPPPGAAAEFIARMTALYGHAPEPLAGLAYEAVALASLLAGQQPGGDGGRFSQQAITNPNGFAGIQGIFRLRPDGLSERGLAVLQITPAGVRMVDPAQEQFTAPTH